MSNTITIGTTIKKKFFISSLTGILLFSSLFLTFGFTGTLFALPLGGMGDFYVEFDHLEGQGFVMHPHLGETGNQDKAPLVRNQMDSATIEGLHIYKDLKLPTGHWIRINILSEGTTSIKGLIQDARFIEANLSFDEMEMKQSDTQGINDLTVLQANWGQNAKQVTITDAKIVTDYLFQNVVSLSGAKISIEGISKQDSQLNESGNNDTTKTVTENGTQDTNKDKVGDDSLPNTASNLYLPLFIGVLVVALGFLLYRVTKGTKDTK